MGASLEGPLAKLARAERQVIVLKDEIESVWPPGKAWPVRTEIDRAGLEYRFYLGELPRVDPDWTLMAGEIMFDLRSALDHLAYQLHVRHYRGRLSPKVEGITQFPIYGHPSSFGQNAYRIAALSRRDRKAIEHLQPYVTRYDKWQFVRPDLGDLNRLHNIDKHRQLHLVTGAHGVAAIPRFPPDVGFRQEFGFRAVKSHSRVEAWTFIKPPPEKQDHSGAYLQVALEDGDARRDLTPLLANFVDSVAHVILRFAGRFPPVEWPSNIAGLPRLLTNPP